MEHLRAKAVLALEEAASLDAAEPVPGSFALRFTLAFLGNFANERWPFAEFGKAATETHGRRDDLGRQQSLNASLNAIYLQLGAERDHSLRLPGARTSS